MLRLVSPPETKKRELDVEEPKGRKGYATMKVPPDIQARVEALKARGYGTSGAIFRMVRSYMEMEDVLGSAFWWDVERSAAEQHVGVGTILGRLAKSALEGQPKRR